MIICTGPESSGTRLLSRIVASSGQECEHRSMPHGEDWRLTLVPGDEVVVILRERMATARSAVAAGHADTLARALSRRELAIGMITERILATGAPSLWVSYDTLMVAPETVLAQLTDFIGAPVSLPEPLRPSTRPR